MTCTVRGATVLVTGAAGGMGRLYALRAAADGARTVVLWDVAAAGLAQVAREVRGHGGTAVETVVDLADAAAIRRAAEQCLAVAGAPDVLVNNAGVVRGDLFWDHTEVDVERTLAVNVAAPMHLTRALLPAMLADTGRERRILNIASAAATVANPRMSVYAGSKWALLGWSESLRLELQQEGHRHLAVTTFCPSFVTTGMFEGFRAPLLTPGLRPEDAVDRAWRAMLAGTPVRYAPGSVRLAMLLRGALPGRVWDVVADRVFGVYGSMAHVRGRGTTAPTG